MACEPRDGSSEPRATRLVLATDGPALELHHLTPAATRVQTLTEPIEFTDLLAIDRPRSAIVAGPPAGANELALVARERRRRQGLRTIHLGPGAAQGARPATLRDGFDAALPQAIDAVVLLARAARWLPARPSVNGALTRRQRAVDSARRR